ncbi:MAG: helix-turn-helix domain-containing protein [Sphingomonas phyllosphaerae]|uniref:helix-turn-helix domain-containing protein n=1 Tax=Sphingomonas phyllosphaerae TaxID=257003 RepID=UPI002FFB5B1D
MNCTYSYDDLTKIKNMVAAGKIAREIAAEMGRSRESIIRVVSRRGLGAWACGKPDLKPVPEGFADAWAEHPQAELRKIYNASSSTVQRWVTICGLQRPRGRNVRPAAKPEPFVRQPAPKRPARVVNRVTAPIDRPHLDNTLAGRAADYLRRFGPVTRCNEAGRYDPNGMFWSRGGSYPLNAEEIVSRARRNGWNPEAWQQVAA